MGGGEQKGERMKEGKRGGESDEREKRRGRGTI